MRKFLMWAAVVTAVLAGCGDSEDGQIWFSRFVDDDIEDFVMNPDGTEVRQLTEDPYEEGGLGYSRVGTIHAFEDRPDGVVGSEVFVWTADGGRQQLTDNDVWDGMPEVSPDGTRIAFASDRSGDREVFVMNADGTGVQQLTDSDGSDSDPVWSPDGERIAFASARDGDMEVFVMNADGSGVQQLTDSDGWDGAFVWSPDGKRIVFASERFGDVEMFVMNADGTNVIATGQQGIPLSWFR